MRDVRTMLKGVNFSQAAHLPVVAAFCRRIGIADAVNAAVPMEMNVDVGTMVQLMVLDTLSGRSPLYHLEEFTKSVDTGLLLAREIPAKAVNDTTVGRTLDAIYAAGTEQLFSQIAFHAAETCPADVLAAYKEQHGIERNFRFLKDPLFVNAMFVKRPDRIEVLGFILLTSGVEPLKLDTWRRVYLRLASS